MISKQKISFIGIFLSFLFVSFCISLAAIASHANNLNSLVGFTKSDFITFAALLRDPIVFQDTISLKIADLAASKASYISFIANGNFVLEHAFFVNYFIQNFLISLGILAIAWTLSRNLIITFTSLLITLSVTEGVFFSIRSNLGFIALGLSFFGWCLFLNGRKIFATIIALIVAFFHPTQAAVMLWSSAALYFKSDLKKTLYIMMSLCLLSVFVFYFLDIILYDFNSINDFQSIKESVFFLNNNSLPLESYGGQWLHFIVILGLLSFSSQLIFNRTARPEINRLSILLLSGTILCVFSMIDHLEFTSPSLLHSFAISFRLKQLFWPLICCIVPVLLLSNLRGNPHTALIKVVMLILLALWSPELLKGGTTHKGSIDIFGSIMFLATLVITACSVWESAPLYKNYVKTTIAIFLVLFSLNYGWYLPIFGIAALFFTLPTRDQQIIKQSQINLTVLAIVFLPIFFFSASKGLTASKIIAELIFEKGQVERLEDNIDPRFRNSGPLFIVPVRSIELTPKYPAFIERLDITYALAMPQLTKEILNRLTFFSSKNELGDLNNVLTDGVSWRSNLQKLKQQYPEVRYIATKPELLCEGEVHEAEIKDVRGQRVLILSVENAFSRC